MTGVSLAKVHQPVLLEEALDMLQVAPGGIYMDGTFGLGGHTREILARSAPDGKVVAFDWDVMPYSWGSKMSATTGGGSRWYGEISERSISVSKKQGRRWSTVSLSISGFHPCSSRPKDADSVSPEMNRWI